VTRDAGFALDDARALAEALADVLTERGLVVAASAASAARVLGVNEVARLLGRRPAWVYQHAAELGAFRFGNGPKARLGFDLASIERWKRDSRTRPPNLGSPPRRRSRQDDLPQGMKLIPYEASGSQA
jgi:predicted DNA-binding transcriptional regulator AlpA